MILSALTHMPHGFVFGRFQPTKRPHVELMLDHTYIPDIMGYCDTVNPFIHPQAKILGFGSMVGLEKQERLDF